MTARAGGSRRGLLVAGLGLAGAYAGLRLGVPALGERLRPLDLVPLDDPPGFRRMAGGATSGAAFDPFVGLVAGGAVGDGPPGLPPDDLCAALFAGADRAPGAVPVAYFSDVACAYCRVMDPRLAALDGAGGVRVVRHELPLLGPASVRAARATLAAAAQGAAPAMQAAAIADARALAPDRLAATARGLGLDPARLARDMDAPGTDRALATSRSLAARFGVPGTPALVVGRTLVVGAVGAGRLDRLIARERADGPVPACAG